jgi:hypothetical protein
LFEGEELLEEQFNPFAPFAPLAPLAQASKSSSRVIFSKVMIWVDAFEDSFENVGP